MDKILIKNCFIFSILLATCNLASAAGLEEDLKELSTTRDFDKKQELIASSLISREIPAIPGYDLSLAQCEAIFAAFRETKTDYSEGLFINLFDKALSEYAQTDNPPPLVNTALAFIESLPKFDNNSRPVIRLGNNYLSEITKLIADALDALPVSKKNLELLVGVLEWERLLPQYQAELFKKILMHKNLLAAMEKLKVFDPIEDIEVARRYFIIYFLNHNADWLMHFRLILKILEEKNTPKDEAEWRDFLLATDKTVLRQLDADLAQGLKFHKGFHTILSDFQNAESVKMRFNVLNRIKENLRAEGPADQHRIDVFKNTFEAALDSLNYESAKNLLAAHIDFIVNNWRLVIPELFSSKSYLEQSAIVSQISFPPDMAIRLANKLLQVGFRKELQQAKLDWLYKSISLPILQSYLKNLVVDSEEKQIEQLRIIEDLLPMVYKTELEQFSKMIFSDLPKPDKKGGTLPPSASPSEVICNQDGYDDEVKIVCTKGAALELDDTTPIGYNIHLPNGPIKAIFTKVYGGFQSKDRTNRMHKPGALDTFDEYLLAQGIAIVTLNLVNLRELNRYQMEMPKELHQRLHASINKYFEVLHSSPEMLHPNLSSLKGKPNFLYGASFGGRTAIKQAELYPKTFSGFLSHDGALSLEGLSQLDLPIIRTGRDRAASPDALTARDWLDPVNGIDAIERPIMLLHNFDDNNVNVGVSLDWYNKAVAAGKRDLVRLLFTTKGNPIPPGEEKIHNKGHFLPTDPESLNRMAEYILRFITKGPTAIPGASELTAHSYEQYAYRNMRRASVIERFLSEAFRNYRHTKPAKITDELWTNQYLPIFLAIYWVDRLSTSQEIEEEIERLSKKNLLSDEVVKNALKSHANMFAEFLIEKYGWHIDPSVLAQLISDNKQIRQQFLAEINVLDLATKDFKSYILRELYVANPDLVKEVISSRSFDDLSEQISKARSAFENMLLKGETIATTTWQEALGQVRALRKMQYENFNKKMAELTAAFPSKQPDRLEYTDLLQWADPFLGNLNYNVEIRSKYRKLVSYLDACKNSDSHCAHSYANALLSLALVLGNSDFMKESLLQSAEVLKKFVPREGLAWFIVEARLAKFLEQLSEQNRKFTKEDLKTFEQLINEKFPK